MERLAARIYLGRSRWRNEEHRLSLSYCIFDNDHFDEHRNCREVAYTVDERIKLCQKGYIGLICVFRINVRRNSRQFARYVTMKVQKASKSPYLNASNAVRNG